MIMGTLIWSLLTSRLGGWVVGGLAVLAALGVLHFEHTWRVKAEAQLEEKTKAMEITKELKELQKEIGDIKAKAAQTRGKLNALEKAGDLGGLADYYNQPNGGVRPVGPPAGGGPGTPGGAGYRGPAGSAYYPAK